MRKIKMLKDIFVMPDSKLKQKIRQDFAGYVKACYKIEQPEECEAEYLRRFVDKGITIIIENRGDLDLLKGACGISREGLKDYEDITQFEGWMIAIYVPDNERTVAIYIPHSIYFTLNLKESVNQ